MQIPTATYRLQFNPNFDFEAAKKIVPYLADLGISHIYASPVFKPRKGSLHGYDIVDQNQLNPEIGTVKIFDELSADLKKRGMGWIQDFTPNHMSYNHENQMLADVLENGQGSKYIDFFDVEWEHPYESLRGRILAPFLGKFYAVSLESGEIQLKYEEDGFAINYYDLKFPLKIESYHRLLEFGLEKLKEKMGDKDTDFLKLLEVIDILKSLPSKGKERHDLVKSAKKSLWELYNGTPIIKSFFDGNLKKFNGEKGKPESFDLLDGLLSEQLFRLSFWKVATEEINYRRFFNINELISLRIEDEKVFEYTHSLLFKLIGEGKIDGVRVDHLDGLYDPLNYLKRLRGKIGDRYLLVEKILDLREELPTDWPVQGTTGYDFLNHANGIFCDQKNSREFERIYSGFTSPKLPYSEIAYDKKKLIIERHMTGDIDNLARLLKRISSRERHGSDITLYGLKESIIEVMSFFPVYRTYAGSEKFGESDKSYIKSAAMGALWRRPDLFNELELLQRYLLLGYRDYMTDEEKELCVHFLKRFQQFTGPLMAKGFEDTVLYVYNRLLSLNEVGGSPSDFGVSLEKFHNFNKMRARKWPHTMNSTSTHDIKRGEDVRARINVLSEIPREWQAAVKAWSRLNRRKKKMVKKFRIPDKNDEYFLYQTLLGAYPFSEEDHQNFIERLKSYIVKSVREAKVHTMWLEPDKNYEEAFVAFVDDILKPSEENQFLKEFLPFLRRVSRYGILNSLSQTLVKIASPGVPDFYQGSEMWDLNLVDPDNRRPVDFGERAKLLEEIKEKEEADLSGLIREMLDSKEDGRIKIFLIHKALEARSKNLEIFQKGDYIPLEVGGKFKDNVIAFARVHDGGWAVAVAPRLLTSFVREEETPLGHIWEDTHVVLPDGAPTLWREAITSRTIDGGPYVRMGEIVKHFPVALLLGGDVKSTTSQ